MKRPMIVALLAGTTLVIALTPHFANAAARSGTIDRIQPTSPAATSRDEVTTQRQSPAVAGQIQEIQVRLKQARKEMQQLQQELQELAKSKPIPPSGNSTSANAQYQKNLNDWNARMNSLQNRISAKGREIKMLEARLRKLQQQSQPLQRR